MSKYISKTSIAACSLLFVLGIFQGWAMYDQRSNIVEKHVAGTNAITLHVILTIALALAIVISIFYQRNAPKKPYIFWAAPFTKEALQRVTNTVFLKQGVTAGKVVRAAVVGFLAVVALFYFFRAGMQIIGSADPNFDTNAWGGPSRLGASVAHYVDAVYLFYVQAWIISLLAFKNKNKSKAKKSKKRS